MWLLHTKTLELRHFVSPAQAPPYSILSHVWQEDDRKHTFHDVQLVHARCLASGGNPLSLVTDKVRKFCILAAGEGYEWAWLDTCCIDKTSSAELSEAIKPMKAALENGANFWNAVRKTTPTYSKGIH